ncbi:MAG: universal stress protein [Desulfovibrionaceae bacterium]
MFKDIVLAITPSEICQHAAEKAFEFAKRFDSKLTLVHVTGMEQGWGQMEYLDRSGETERIRENICEYYKDKLDTDVKCDIKVLAGIPHNEILRIARRASADLIVMGPHTREYAEKRSKMWGMAGSTLERVSQKAACPVMIVTREARLEQRFERIMAATDFSHQAECAVQYGGQLCRHYNAELTVFHVLGEEEGMSQSQIEEQTRQAKERMEADFGQLLKGIKAVNYEAWEGKPAMEILKLARQSEADLILMAHHSKEKDPEKAFLGSVVAQVSLNAVCPTMSINRHFDLRCGMMYDQSGEAVDKDQERSKDEAPA